MKAFLINPETRRVTAFEFDGKPQTLRGLVGGPFNGISLEDRDDGHADVLFANRDISELEHISFFMISALPMPIGGISVIIGMNEKERRDNKDQALGDPHDALVTLNWLNEHVMWLERVASEDRHDSVAFKPVDSTPQSTIAKVVACIMEHGQVAGQSPTKH